MADHVAVIRVHPFESRGRIHLTRKSGFIPTRESKTLCGLQVELIRATRSNSSEMYPCVICSAIKSEWDSRKRRFG